MQFLFRKNAGKAKRETVESSSGLMKSFGCGKKIKMKNLQFECFSNTQTDSKIYFRMNFVFTWSVVNQRKEQT